MSSAYTEQDLRKAEQVAEELAKPKAYWDCDWSGDTDGTERLTINVPAIAKHIAAEFARIRSEARAGMREACAGHYPVLEDGPSDSDVLAYLCCQCGDRPREDEPSDVWWGRHIRKLPDTAAAEAIERIKREARLEEAKWWRHLVIMHEESYFAVEGDKRIAALEGKEPSQ